MIKIILLYEAIGFAATIFSAIMMFKKLATKYKTTMDDVINALDEYDNGAFDTVFDKVLHNQTPMETIVGVLAYVLAWPISLPAKVTIAYDEYDYRVRYILEQKKEPV